MRLRHGAALALVGWCLMLPPDAPDKSVLEAQHVPLSKWIQVGEFDTAAECNHTGPLRMTQAWAQVPDDTKPNTLELRTAQHLYNYRCFASDDPRLPKIP